MAAVTLFSVLFPWRSVARAEDVAPAGTALTFDRDAVIRMIENIDGDHNATLLRLLYFGSHEKHLFPKESALPLLRGAIEEADTGSRRWFLLETVEAYGLFRMGKETRAGAYDAYGAIFSQTQDAEKSGAVDAAEQAIHDYALTLQGMYGPKHFESEWGTAGEVLAKALQQHLSFIKAGEPVRADIPWTAAVKETFRPEQFPEIMDTALRDSGMPRTYELLVVAAAIYERKDPGRAAQLLVEASRMNEPGGKAGIVAPAEVNALVAADRWKDAAAAQDILVKQTGKGGGRLAWLCLKAGDRESFKKDLAALEQPDAAEPDVMQLAEILAQMRDSDPASPVGRQAVAISLLSNYLGVERPRTIYYEVNARLLLAHLYLDSRRPAEARKTVEAQKLTEAMPRPLAARWGTESKRVLQLSDAALAAVQDKTKPDPGVPDKTALDNDGKESVK